ncbi:Solute carrier family 40 member 3, chloroplastic [Dichanthelium oligosanthes]|uniref:Solute carrier family 40 member n=1 Tax=Dichanthelium oligosanthes TaxID=888268 RepID=A0A1E5WND1_9POAL|nr:Solute carrier family 40 member 3, chloroplastic [Dichanthelium oligosanthes]
MHLIRFDSRASLPGTADDGATDMAPFLSELLSPPPSHAASTSLRCLRPLASAVPLNRGPDGHRIAPPPPPSLRTTRRFAACRASADRAGGATTGLAGGDGAAAEERNGLPFVQMSSDILQTELSLLKDDTPAAASSSLLTMLPVLEKGDGKEDRVLRDTPAYPAAMNALYAACLAGNVTEQLWNFTWPAAIASLHPSLLPVAVLGFFTKLVVFAAGPLVGDLISSLPRIPAYRSLTVIQTAAHWVSAAMIAYAFTLPRVSTAPELLLQPWFAVLVASTAVDRLSCVSLGVIAERDFVVQLAGESRPVALARANATLSRVDLLCETAGASIFAVLLSRNNPLTCIRLSCAISLCALPLLLFLAGAMNRLAEGIFDFNHSALGSLERSVHGCTHTASAFSVRNKVEEAWATIRHGWIEYIRQPVLPASLAYVLACFNVALAPGALMTTFLIHHGVSASVLGAFGGSSAVVGILATFMIPNLVKELGILKAGAAGLIAQSALLGAAVLVFLTGPVSRQGTLFAFLGLIVASRLGHMAYSVIGLQVVQTGNPMGKAKLIGATEIAVASLAELAMMTVAVVARDAAHFGWLAALSAASVAAAACLFCAWLANPTDELKRLFPC